MKSLLKWLLIGVSGNRFVQHVLEKNVYVSHYLMGIGAGGSVLSSGEREIFKLLRSRVKPPYCVFDIGSNRGQFLKLVLQGLAGFEFRVHCFEPGIETFKMLKDAVGADARVHLNNLGLGREKGSAVLYFDKHGSGLASLTQRKLDHVNIVFGKSEHVRIGTIDDYCEEHSIDRINLLKIDIEGHELDALRGAQKMFAKKAVDIVTFEFGGCNIDTKSYFRDFWYLLKDLGFDVYRITPSGYFAHIATYSERQEQFMTNNFVAIFAGKP